MNNRMKVLQFPYFVSNGHAKSNFSFSLSSVKGGSSLMHGGIGNDSFQVPTGGCILAAI